MLIKQDVNDIAAENPTEVNAHHMLLTSIDHQLMKL